MKNQVLSIEQMQRLKELGVDTSKASMVCLFQDDESNIYDWDEVVEECSEFGDCFQYFVKNDEGNRNMVYMSLLNAEGGNYDHSYREDCTVFTLQDIIELLPKKIRDFELNWYMHNMIIRYDYYNSFDGIDVLNGSSFGFCDNNSLLESAYEMLIWVAENGYLKTK